MLTAAGNDQQIVTTVNGSQEHAESEAGLKTTQTAIYKTSKNKSHPPTAPVSSIRKRTGAI
jgi:hypothetical protein